MFEKLRGRKDECDVLVVGAGLVGLCHAILLAKNDLDVCVIDAARESERRDEWVVLEPDALGLLESLGVLPQLADSFTRLTSIAVGTAASGGLELPVSELAVAQPYLAVARRAALEDCLLKKAEKAAITVRWLHRLQRLELHSESCVAQVERLSMVSEGYAASTTETVVQRSQEIRALWVIGADGRNSIVRRDLKSSFTPIGEPLVNVIAEVESDHDSGNAARVVPRDDGADTLLPLGGRRYLWVGSYTDERSPKGVEIDRQLQLAADPIQRGTVSEDCIYQALETLGIHVRVVRAQHALRFQPRRAKPPGRGRAWLSGAAAQIVGPAQGLDDSLGMREVRDLALLLGLGGNGAHKAPSLTAEMYEQRRTNLLEEALGGGQAAALLRRLVRGSEQSARRVSSHLPILGGTRQVLLTRAIRSSELTERTRPVSLNETRQSH